MFVYALALYSVKELRQEMLLFGLPPNWIKKMLSFTIQFILFVLVCVLMLRLSIDAILLLCAVSLIITIVNHFRQVQHQYHIFGFLAFICLLDLPILLSSY